MQTSRDRVADCSFIIASWAPQDPGRHLIFLTRVADAKTKPVEFPVAEYRQQVTQTILATVTAIEFQPCRAGREIELVVRDQGVFGLNLEVAQRRRNRLPTAIHERGRL